MTDLLSMRLFVQGDGVLFSLGTRDHRKVLAEKTDESPVPRVVFLGLEGENHRKVDQALNVQKEAYSASLLRGLSNILPTVLPAASILTGELDRSSERWGVQVLAGHSDDVVWSWSEVLEAARAEGQLE